MLLISERVCVAGERGSLGKVIQVRGLLASMLLLSLPLSLIRRLSVPRPRKYLSRTATEPCSAKGLHCLGMLRFSSVAGTLTSYTNNHPFSKIKVQARQPYISSTAAKVLFSHCSKGQEGVSVQSFRTLDRSAGPGLSPLHLDEEQEK